MPRWQALLMVLTLLILAGVLAWRWHGRRAAHLLIKESWIPVVGRVTGHGQMDVFKGTATTLQGYFEVDGQSHSHSFDVFWDRNTWKDGTWQSPANTPPIGSKVALRYDPKNPAHMTTEHESSGGLTTTSAFTGIAILLSLAGLVLWAWRFGAAKRTPKRLAKAGE